MASVEGLDDQCGSCGREMGAHTLREFAACLETPSHNLPYEAFPADSIDDANEALRRKFQLDGDVIVADSVVAYSATLTGDAGPIGVSVPAVIHEFQQGTPAGPRTVAKVVYLSPADAMRKYGTLIYNTAWAAAKGAE